MASEQARALRAEIAKRRSSAAVALGGLGPVLDILDAYVVATESRLHALERAAGDLGVNLLRLDAGKDVYRLEIDEALRKVGRAP